MRAAFFLFFLLLLLLPSVPALAGPAPRDDVPLFDKVYLKGNPEPMECTIVEEKATEITIRPKGSTSTIILSRDQIARIEKAPKPEAIYELRKGQATDGPSHLALALWCQRHSLETKAEHEARLAIGADPKLADAYRFLVSLYEERRKRVAREFHPGVHDRELDALVRAEAAGALAPDLAVRKASLLLELGEPEAALLTLERLRPALEATDDESDPGSDQGGDIDPEVRRNAFLLLGDLALGLGRHEAAERDYRAVLARDSADPRALTSLGLAAFGRGDLAAAAAAFDQAMQAAPGLPDPVVFRGATAYHAGDIEKAETLLEEIVQKGTRRPDLFLYAGLTALRRGKVGRAEAHLTAALALEPTSAEATIGVGLAGEMRGQPETAFALYAKAAVDDPTVAGLARLVEAEALLALGDASRAETALRAALKGGHDLADVASLLGRVRRAAGDFRTAARYARYAAKQRPRDVRALYELGLSHLGAGSPDEAEAAFDAALSIDPTHAPSLCGRGRVLYDRGEFADARDCFDRARAQGSAYGALAIRRLDEARTRRLWRDDFRRPDAPEPRNHWKEEERHGPLVAVAQNRLRIAGAQARAPFEPTGIWRRIEKERFAEARVRIDCARAGPARAGIRLVGLREGEIAFFRTPDDGLAYAVKPPGKDIFEEPRPCPRPFPVDGKPHTLSIGVAPPAEGGKETGELVLGLDGEEVARVKSPGLSRLVTFTVWIEARAPKGEETFEVFADEVRIYVFRDPKKDAP